jgi:hypothetical protein
MSILEIPGMSYFSVLRTTRRPRKISNTVLKTRLKSLKPKKLPIFCFMGASVFVDSGNWEIFCAPGKYIEDEKTLNLNFRFGGIILDRVDSINDLGVIMDSKMFFTGNIDITVGRALAMLGFVKRLACEFRDPYTLKTRPCMFPLCTRNLNTPVVCDGLSMTHTSIELSVRRRNS